MSTSNAARDTMAPSILALLLCSGPLAWAQSPPAPAGPSLLASAESAVRKDVYASPPGTAPTGGQPAVQRRDMAAAFPRPRLSGSTTGYVENAFIGSQVRLRFDAGFGLGAPDKTEFFYAKCGCYRLAGLDPDAPGPVPPFAGGDPAVTPLIENDLDYRDFQVYAEYAPHERFSVFADLPVRSLSPSIIPKATGIGDVHAGVRLGLVANDVRALTFQFQSYFPTGDSEKGLGTDHPSVEFTMLYNDTLAERVSLGAELGAWRPINPSSAIPVATDEDFACNVLRWGVGLGVDLVATPQFSFAPVVEVVGWRLFGGYASVTPDGTPGKLQILSVEGSNIVNLKLGGRVTFNGRNSVYAGYGFHVTDDHWYDDVVRVEYRLAF